MTVGKISLAFFLAVLMAVFSPGVLRMTMAATAEQAAPVVPMGEELDETELVTIDGSFFLTTCFLTGKLIVVPLVKKLLGGAAIGAGGVTIYDAVHHGRLVSGRRALAGAAAGAFTFAAPHAVRILSGRHSARLLAPLAGLSEQSTGQHYHSGGGAGGGGGRAW